MTTAQELGEASDDRQAKKLIDRIYFEQLNGVLCLPPNKEVAEDVWTIDTAAASDSGRYCKRCRQIWIDLEALALSKTGGSV